MEKKDFYKISVLVVLGMLMAIIMTPLIFAAPSWDTGASSNKSYYIAIDANNDDNDDQAFGVFKNGAPNSGTETELFRIQENGYVGIGTTSPSAELTVIGDVGISGSLGADNGGFTVDSTNHRVGINDGSPARKLEIIDGTDTPQLRLTDWEDVDYTDFHTMANGYLLIQPSGNRVAIATTSDPVTTLDVNGGLATNIIETSTFDYDVLNSDFTILCDSGTSGAATKYVNLPDANSCIGKILVIKKVAGTQVLKIHPYSGDNIDGSTSDITVTTNDSYILQSYNANNWYILASH